MAAVLLRVADQRLETVERRACGARGGGIFALEQGALVDQIATPRGFGAFELDLVAADRGVDLIGVLDKPRMVLVAGHGPDGNGAGGNERREPDRHGPQDEPAERTIGKMHRLRPVD